MTSAKQVFLLALLNVSSVLAQGYGGGAPGSNGGGNNGQSSGGPPAGAEAAQAAARAKHVRMMKIVMAHGVMMSLAFAFMMPFGSALIRILKVRGTAWIHGAWQITAYIVALAAFGIGVYLAYTEGALNQPHPIIGIIVISVLFLQPIGGWLAHRVRVQKGYRNLWGLAHRWIGRIFVTLAVINGGLGIQLSGPKRPWVIGYSVTAAFFVTLWWAASIFDWVRHRRNESKLPAGDEKGATREQYGSVAS